MALKMRQSLAQLEQDFRHEIQRDKHRREHLRRSAVRRSRQRGIERARKKSAFRFWMLVMTLLATAVIVTVAMFETLYLLLGR
jgi:Flp pilus assembly protein TadB